MCYVLARRSSISPIFQLKKKFTIELEKLKFDGKMVVITKKINDFLTINCQYDMIDIEINYKLLTILIEFKNI